MPFIVLYDANALYPNAQRDLLIRIAREGLVQAKWTDQILDEMIRSRARNHPDVPHEKLDRLRNLMNEAVADCLVSGYEDLIDALKLPDTGDRHVLAAAIRLAELERSGLLRSASALRSGQPVTGQRDQES